MGRNTCEGECQTELCQNLCEIDSDRMAAKMPGRMSALCQIECQKEFHMECLNTSKYTSERSGDHSKEVVFKRCLLRQSCSTPLGTDSLAQGGPYDSMAGGR